MNPTEEHTRVNGTDLYCTTVGEGVPLLLMHGGLGLDHTYFRPFLDPVSSVAELIFYDHRGQGRSSAVRSWTGIDHATFLADADALRAHLGHERIVVLGHSYGGFLAQEYALRYGDRLAGLILCSTAPALDYAGDLRQLVSAAGVHATPEQLETAEQLFSGAAESDEAFRQQWETILPLYFKTPDAQLLSDVEERIIFRADVWRHAVQHLLPTFNVVDRLREVVAPVLVLGGRYDWIIPPAQVERLHALVPHSEVVIFERSGHFSFVEEQDRFVAIVTEWLARVV